ncbi:hypothetical protein niasHS_013946 [Heterodera schachtii]|uniref:Prolyl 4-hydroxylase alpha subunit domain-containing protein n=1 Tax=Heterodera schachtii TaxID=97005 RepID=A0ABD2IHN7_HETSC
MQFSVNNNKQLATSPSLLLPSSLLMMLLLFASALVLRVAVADVFTAMVDLENLLASESASTSDIIEQYIEAERARLVQFSDEGTTPAGNKQHSVQLEPGEVDEDSVMNPVNAYLLIKRLTRDWQRIRQLMNANPGDQFIKNITGVREANAVKYPDDEDLDGAAQGLLRLQDTYKLKTTDLANGFVDGESVAKELNANDCFESGQAAYNQKDYYYTLEWMQEALRRDPSATLEADILEFLAYALYQQGNQKRALAMTKWLVRLAPGHPRAAGNVKWYEDHMTADELASLNELPEIQNERKRFNDIPSGTHLSVCAVASLKFRPQILPSSTVISSGTRDEHPISERINRRIHEMTNLDMESAEELQVANYGIGGHYDPHFDFARSGEKSPYKGKGNRIATVLFYMSQPKKVGLTVYTDLETGVAPTIHDTLFWYNLLRDGEGDMRTRHLIILAFLPLKIRALLITGAEELDFPFYLAIFALCRGEFDILPANASKLYCYLKRDKPYLKLAPHKVEIVHYEPLVVVFRNVISDAEIAVVKQLATPRQQRRKGRRRSGRFPEQKLNPRNVDERRMCRFLIADPSPQDEADNVQQQMYEEQKKHGDLLLFRFVVKYLNLHFKSFGGFVWQQRHCASAEWMLKMDDDTVVLLPRMAHWIETKFRHIARKHPLLFVGVGVLVILYGTQITSTRNGQ